MQWNYRNETDFRSTESTSLLKCWSLALPSVSYYVTMSKESCLLEGAADWALRIPKWSKHSDSLNVFIWSSKGIWDHW